jgi:hypothetical protein
MAQKRCVSLVDIWSSLALKLVGVKKQIFSDWLMYFHRFFFFSPLVSHNTRSGGW